MLFSDPSVTYVDDKFMADVIINVDVGVEISPLGGVEPGTLGVGEGGNMGGVEGGNLGGVEASYLGGVEAGNFDVDGGVEPNHNVDEVNLGVKTA